MGGASSVWRMVGGIGGACNSSGDVETHGVGVGLGSELEGRWWDW